MVAAFDGVFPLAPLGGATAATVVSATVIDSTHVDVLFSKEMYHVSAVGPYDSTNPALYTITGGPRVLTVSLAALQVAAPTRTRLTTLEMTTGAAYTVTVAPLLDVPDDLPLDPRFDTAGFVGAGVAPQVVAAVATSEVLVNVEFDSTMNNNAALVLATNYTFVGPTALTATHVTRIDGTHVDVTVNEMQQAGAYTVTVTNVSDEASNVIDPAHDDANFLGLGVAPFPVSAAATDSTTIRVTFSEDMTNNADLIDPANYAIAGAPALVPTGVVRIDAMTVDVTVNAMTTAAPYVLTPSVMIDTAGNVVTGTVGFVSTGEAPSVYIYPVAGSTGLSPREAFVARAVDDVTCAGIDPTTWVITVNDGGTTYTVMTGGAFQTNWTGEFSGSDTDFVDGTSISFQPVRGKWSENTAYDVTVHVHNLSGYIGQATATLTTGASTCFEDHPATSTALETILLYGTMPDNCSQLRARLLASVSLSSIRAVQARTVLVLSHSTDLFGLLADWVDTRLLDVNLCDRQPAITTQLLMAPYLEIARKALKELTPFSNAARNSLESRLLSQNPVYAVNAVAVLVVAAAVFVQEGWL